MKKVFTILFIFVVFFSGTTIRYSAHYCQGSFIASKLSITGESATCGMPEEKHNSKDLQFSDLMCVNEITAYTMNDNYVYSPHSPEQVNQIQAAELPLMLTPKTISSPASTEFTHMPPGSPGLPKVESEVLCVFRI